MKLPDLAEIEAAAEFIYRYMQASPQLTWPLLNNRAEAEVWVKHENHNPTGAFKVRGGLIYMSRLKASEPDCPGICSATRGNHGQSIGFASQILDFPAVIFVPLGNNPDKNAAMKALGVELIVHGRDFDEAAQKCREVSEERGLHYMPSIGADLIAGVATYALEFFRGAPELDRIYVPIGLGSGICGVIAAKKALGVTTEIVGVVSAHANTYQLSLEAGRVIPTSSADTIADGLAVRNPSQDALELIREEVSGVVTVTDDEVLHAIGCYFSDTHNIAEGAGASSLAAVLKDDTNRGQRVGVVLSGGNISKPEFLQALATVTG